MNPVDSWAVVGHLARAATSLLVLATRHTGSLPHFVLLGAQKAGTTSFFSALTAHPRIQTPRKRELHYFNRKYRRGLWWYQRRFPDQNALSGGTITGEGSPSYLCHPRAPARICKDLPNAKFIAILRDPVTRAISHYFHERRKGREPLSIEQAFASEEGRLEPVLRRMEKDPNLDSGVFRSFTYKYRGRYAEQLERYLALIPRERLLILRSEDFFAQPKAVVERAQRFLGVDPAQGTADYARRNQGTYEKEEVAPEIYDDLTRYFAPHNERLYQLLGSDWGWRRPR